MVVGLIAKEIIKRHLKARVDQDWERRSRHSRKHHGLKKELIISLTSFPKRFSTLPSTLKCLLNQNIVPDRVILWLGHEDMKHLTPEIRALQDNGLEIRGCADYKQYNKIVHSLSEFPDAFIVTADDDLYYWRTWLAELVDKYDHSQWEVICHRAHHIEVDADGLPRPYKLWQQNISSNQPGHLVFPTGVGGVLYRPGLFPQDALDEAAFLSLSPSADDIWLYFMARRSGATFRKIGPKRHIVTWPGSQKISLRSLNVPVGGGNDQCMRQMVDAYGFPPRLVSG